MSAARWRLEMSRWLLAAHLLAGAGCLSCLNPVKPPAPELLETCHSVPTLGRNHVFIFFIGSLDPLDCANLSGVRDYVQSIGFIKTYYGQAYHACWFKSEMRRLHEEDPTARFVLIGHGVGANTAHDLAKTLEKDDIPIDLLVYVDGTRLDNRCRRAKNVARVVHISGTYCLSAKRNLRGVENIHVHEAGCFGAATHPQTLDLLAEELTQVASRVPIALPPESTEAPNPEIAPTPRPVVPQPTKARDEWDFLKPVASLQRSTQPAAEPRENTVQTHSVSKPKQDNPKE